MKLKTSVALVPLLLVVLAASSCKDSTNSNRLNEATPKPGRWIAQYKPPDSRNFTATNLALFSYSGISVVSPQIVFVCGDVPRTLKGEDRVGVILRTTDGGAQWNETRIDLPGIQIPTLNAIHFVSPDVGWAVGADITRGGVILKTTDGGANWAATKIAYKQVPTCVFFTDANTGWIGGATPPPGEDEGVGGPSAILSTTDGGQTWNPQYNVAVSVLQVFFIDKDTGWASGTKGAMFNTTDGGRTWDTQRTEIEAGDGPVDLNSEGAKQFEIRGVHFADKQNGLAAAGAAEGGAGRVIATSNGGATWRRTWIVVGNRVQDVYLLNPNEGFALMDGGGLYAYRTVDGGRTWLSEPVIIEQDVKLHRFGAADASHIWAVGGGGIFFRLNE